MTPLAAISGRWRGPRAQNRRWLAAHAQGKFWPMHDKLYANFRDLSPEKINQWATEAGLDLVRFTMDLKSGKYKPALQKDLAEGEQILVKPPALLGT